MGVVSVGSTEIFAGWYGDFEQERGHGKNFAIINILFVVIRDRLSAERICQIQDEGSKLSG